MAGNASRSDTLMMEYPQYTTIMAGIIKAGFTEE